MEEEQKEGVGLGEILSVIWKRIVWILGISVLAALVCGLVVKFVASPSKESYRLSFMLEYPIQFDEETGNMIYPDGTPLRFESAFYADRLNAVKESNEEFSGIDTAKMASEISVEQSSANSETELPVGKFTVTVPSRYFQSEAQATDFLKAVCAGVKESILGKVKEEDYTAALTRYDVVTSFASQIEILENQQEFLLSVYDAYLPLYKSFKFKAEGEQTAKSIEFYRAEAADLFNGSVILAVLKTDLQNNLYLHKETEDDVLTQIKALRLEQDANNAACEALETKVKEFMAGASSELTSEGLAAYHNKISIYTERNAQIATQIAALEESLDADSSAFAEKLDFLYEAVRSETETCKAVVTALYDANTVFSYEQGSVSLFGSMSVWKYVIIVFIVAFVLAAAVFCIADFTRKKKAELAKNESKTAESATEKCEDDETLKK